MCTGCGCVIAFLMLSFFSYNFLVCFYSLFAALHTDSWVSIALHIQTHQRWEQSCKGCDRFSGSCSEIHVSYTKWSVSNAAPDSGVLSPHPQYTLPGRQNTHNGHTNKERKHGIFLCYSLVASYIFAHSSTYNFYSLFLSHAVLSSEVIACRPTAGLMVGYSH